MNQSQDEISRVVVHPLVLLSVVDHFNRAIKGARNKRVVGVLLGFFFVFKIMIILGSNNKGILDITNCFAIPFEEHPRERSVWFLDHLYLEKMAHMFNKVIQFTI